MRIRPFLLASALLFILPGAVPADPPGGYLGKDEVAAEARRQVNGRILSIRLHDKPTGAPVYRVKVLKDGDVYQLNIPAQRSGNHNARPRR